MIPLALAQAKAVQVAAYLGRWCDDIAIAGSVRRQAPQVKDLEIVVRPIFQQRDMWGAPDWHSGTSLDAVLDRLVANGTLAWDTDVPRNGPRYKRFVIQSLGLPCDLFLADEWNFGNMVAIRTGAADFSRRLVTPTTLNGLMPRGYRQRDGYLYGADGQRVACPTETAFFAALGIDAALIPVPADRTGAAIDQVREHLKWS